MQGRDAARELLREFEGLRLGAYVCPGGVLTIGYGHTGTVRAGQTITLAEAERLLEADMRAVEEAMQPLITAPLNANQHGALLCFVFNIGLAAFRRSTLLARLNRGDYKAVPHELQRWAHARGVRLPGLVRRREAETRLWLMPFHEEG